MHITVGIILRDVYKYTMSFTQAHFGAKNIYLKELCPRNSIRQNNRSIMFVRRNHTQCAYTVQCSTNYSVLQITIHITCYYYVNKYYKKQYSIVYIYYQLSSLFISVYFNEISYSLLQV